MIPDVSLLTNQLSASASDVEKKLSSRTERFCTWNAKRKKEIPAWCQKHIEIHKSFEKMLGEIRAQGQEVSISPEMMHVYKKSQELLGKLSGVTYYPKFLELIQAGKTRDPQSPLMVRPNQEERIQPHHFQWHLNTALLMDVHKRTSNQALKKQIEFLILNYLAKAASIGVEDNRAVLLSQVGAFDDLIQQEYHRESSVYESLIKNEILKQLPKNYLMQTSLIDSEEIASLLPLTFTVIETPQDRGNLVKSWSTGLDKALESHRAKHGEQWSESFINPPLLFDVTDLLAQYIKTGGDQEKERLFNDEVAKIKNACKLAVDDIIRLKYSHLPIDEQNKLRAFLLVNTNFVCRTTLNEIGLLTQISFLTPEDFPEFNLNSFLGISFKEKEHERNVERILAEGVENFQAHTTGFINHTGTRVGGVNVRMKFLNFLNLEQLLENDSVHLRQVTEYAVPGANPIIYPNKESIINSVLFKDFKAMMSEPKLEAEQPHIAIFGKATVDLFEGLLLNEIGEEKWAAINANPDTRMLLQTSLFRAMQHLAKAKSRCLGDEPPFTEFAQALELVHCELATLLAITTPFKESDFEEIYKQQLSTVVPEGLRRHLKVGLTKSAMNTMAGINAAVKEMNPQATRAYMSGSYYESMILIGENLSTDQVIANPEIKAVDLFVGEFNHNIDIHLNHSHYTLGDMIGEIDRLLEAKPETQELSVGVDCTIDFFHSLKAKALLEHYEGLINSGKLNFVFLRSGQKFDMLGMDNYYAAPFYIVNNGDAKWNAFNRLMTSPAHKTDPLSLQWFCLANKYASRSMDLYRAQIFKNTRAILDQVPAELLPGVDRQEIRVSTCDRAMDAPFIDIKVLGKKLGYARSKIEELLLEEFLNKGSMIYSRNSFGFYHPNYNIIGAAFDDGQPRNFRINPGLDPHENATIIAFLNKVVGLTKE